MSISGRTASVPTSSATPTRGVTSTRSTSSGTHDDKIYISYGRADYPRELRNVYIRRGRLTGELFIDGQYYDRITLYMQ